MYPLWWLSGLRMIQEGEGAAKLTPYTNLTLLSIFYCVGMIQFTMDEFIMVYGRYSPCKDLSQKHLQQLSTSSSTNEETLGRTTST